MDVEVPSLSIQSSNGVAVRQNSKQTVQLNSEEDDLLMAMTDEYKGMEEAENVIDNDNMVD